MAFPYYDAETEGVVYLVRPEQDDACDGDGSDVDTISSSTTTRTASTITSDQIGDYFREAHGRTFAYDQNLPLTYPIDDIEIHRHQMQHVFLKALVHGNYIGPVRDVLRLRADGSRPRILDIRTCTGDWAQEMATEFPHCDIVSVDVAPVTSHIPRSNISFEVYDLYSGIAEPNESFDYVSCRHIQLHVGLFHLKYQAIKINLCEFLTQVKEYDRLIFDLHRVLKPGGLVTICEVENNIFEVDQPPYDTIAYRTAPSMLRGLDAMRTAVTYQGIDIDAIYRLDEWLQPDSTFWAETAEKYEIPEPQRWIASRGFRDIQKEVVLIPIGAWHPDPAVQQVGALVARTFSLSYRQLEPAIIETGVPQDQAKAICDRVIEEMVRMDLPTLAKYHMVYGTKI
ncbi:Methyltransferase domain containing protein [Ceratobasidium theobromae]|uniref:Methyltransferase domain containing protein n=1 Tax=Ceratobasidium theobromae TaxID=1582974 RepID=A0A5N5QKL9_9AGAM|nr:Methyltransferase domain containing protein [Ceratobasidium theobromae]